MNTFRFKFYIDDKVEQEPVGVLRLSNRAMNALMRQKIATIGALVDHWDKFDRTRGVGERTMKEIHAALFAYNLERIWNDDAKMLDFADSLEVKA